MPVFPANISEIKPELMSQLLSEKHQGVIVKSVDLVEHASCGDGLASTADRLTLRLRYEPGHETGLPEQFKLKTIFLNRWLRFGMPTIIGTAKVVNLLEKIPLLGRFSAPLIFSLINFYQRYFPHAPEAMYRNEVNFYQKVRDKLSIEAPRCYAAVMNERDGQFGILMEDLGLNSARFPNALDGVSLLEMRSLVVNLAHLHAHYWQSPELDTELSWLPKTFEGGMFPVFDNIGRNIIRDQVGKNPFKQELIAPLNRSIDELWSAMWQSQRIIYRQPHTLLHGDTHIGNTYLLPDGRAGLLDWQLIVRGPWCHDFAYLVITGLDIETRRENERDLLNLYLETLQACGVKNTPTTSEAILLYRQSAIWGLVIGWLITPPQNYGEDITAANIKKTVTAMQDLETLKSLETEA